MRKLLLCAYLCPLALFPELVSGDTAPAEDARTWRAIVCETPQEAFAAVWDVSNGKGINGSCHRATLSKGLRETVSISSPYPAAFFDFGDHTAVEIR